MRFERGGVALRRARRARRPSHRTPCLRAKPRPQERLGEQALAPGGGIKVGEDAQGKPLQTEYVDGLRRRHECRRRILGPGKTSACSETLEIAVETTAIKHRLPYADERVSTREALHEDLYFLIPAYFKAANGFSAEDRGLQVGRLSPTSARGRERRSPRRHVRATIPPGRISTSRSKSRRGRSCRRRSRRKWRRWAARD